MTFARTYVARTLVGLALFSFTLGCGALRVKSYAGKQETKGDPSSATQVGDLERRIAEFMSHATYKENLNPIVDDWQLAMK